MTANDISGYFVAIRAIASEVAGSDTPEKERQVIKTLVEASLRLGEGALIDLNRSADALESISVALNKMVEQEMWQVYSDG